MESLAEIPATLLDRLAKKEARFVVAHDVPHPVACHDHEFVWFRRFQENARMRAMRVMPRKVGKRARVGGVNVLIA